MMLTAALAVFAHAAIDSPIAAANPPINIFTADFSDGVGDPSADAFTSSGSNDLWHVSTGRGGDAGHSADDSFYFGSGEGPSGGGLYSNNADGQLISPIIDLSGLSGIEVQLSFNHFLQVEAGFDFASVNVVTGGSSTLVATSAVAPVGVLQLPSSTSGFENVMIDISAFVSQQIQVEFSLTSDGSVTAEGWYVDDVQIDAFPPDPLTPNSFFLADFSDAGGNARTEGFTTSGPNSQWHLSTGRGADPGHSADDSFYFGAGEGPGGGGSYANNADGTLLSPIVDLSGVGGPIFLSFDHFLDVEQGFDFADVNIFIGGAPTLVATSNFAPMGVLQLPSSTGGFENILIDISSFAGQQIQIGYRLTSDSSVIGEGWYVDDVHVFTPIPAPAALPAGLALLGAIGLVRRKRALRS